MDLILSLIKQCNDKGSALTKRYTKDFDSFNKKTKDCSESYQKTTKFFSNGISVIGSIGDL